MTTKLDNLDNLNNSAQNLVRNKRGALGFLAVKNVQQINMDAINLSLVIDTKPAEIKQAPQIKNLY